MTAVLPTYATTIAGALLPVLVAVFGALTKLYFQRLEKRWELGHKETLEGQNEVLLKLAEAEGALRGDLKNGVKDKLDVIEKKVDTAKKVAEQTKEERVP